MASVVFVMKYEAGEGQGGGAMLGWREVEKVGKSHCGEWERRLIKQVKKDCLV